MKTDRTIPIVVGVTGHRKIRPEDYAAIFSAVKTELEKLNIFYPNSPVVMLNSLAEGGDLLCAEAAEELDIPIIAALPRARESYEQDFSEEAKKRFAHHCSRAEQVFVTPLTEAVPESGENRNFQFRQAGIYVATHCHVLLALWDGEPGTKAACGTAEAVDFALKGNFQSRDYVPLYAEESRVVIHILTPRSEYKGEAAGTIHLLGNHEAVRKTLRETDEFNERVQRAEPVTKSRLPEAVPDDPVLERMESISLTAGKQSSFYARRFRLILGLIAMVSSILTLAFLLYDEAQMIGMILVCGVMLAAAWGFQRYAVRTDCHRRYVEYRALAECLRVQTYLRYAGSGLETAELLTWTQREETAWITAALRALSVGSLPKEAHEIRMCWVEEQRDYHQKAGKQAKQRTTVSGRIVNTALVLSVALYCFALGYELLCGDLIFEPVIRMADVEVCRTVLKILLGTISASTLFTANYYGKLSLPRTLSDHEKMERFYGRISALLNQYGQTELLLKTLAREELIENGNWVSYQRDNKPEISF